MKVFLALAVALAVVGVSIVVGDAVGVRVASGSDHGILFVLGLLAFFVVMSSK